MAENEKNGKKPLIAVIVVLVVVIAGLIAYLARIQSNAQPASTTVQATLEPTNTPEQTEAPTDTLNPTDTPIPTDTPKPTDTPEPTATPVRLQVDPNAGELITPEPTPVDPGVTITGWGGIKLPAGKLEASTALYNPIENDGWYDMTFELRMAETGEVIFTTGLVPPGQYCNKVTLTRKLEAGQYAGILHVQPYRQDEAQTPTNNVDLDIAIIVN